MFVSLKHITYKMLENKVLFGLNLFLVSLVLLHWNVSSAERQ